MSMTDTASSTVVSSTVSTESTTADESAPQLGKRAAEPLPFNESPAAEGDEFEISV
jgi:hypothetical protein